MSLASSARLTRLSLRRGDLLAAAAIAVPVILTLTYRAVHDHHPLLLLLAPPALAPVFLRDRRPQ